MFSRLHPLQAFCVDADCRLVFQIELVPYCIGLPTFKPATLTEPHRSPTPTSAPNINFKAARSPKVKFPGADYKKIGNREWRVNSQRSLRPYVTSAQLFGKGGDYIA
jgi:hypothetical protein